MAGTLVLTDTIAQTFDDLFADVNRGTDAFVRAPERVRGRASARPRGRASTSGSSTRSPPSTAWPRPEPFVQGYARIIDKDGEPVGDPNFGAPTFGGNWGEVDELNPFNLVEGGRPPRGRRRGRDRQAHRRRTGYEVGDDRPRRDSTTPAGEQEYDARRHRAVRHRRQPGRRHVRRCSPLETAMLRVTEPGKVDAIGVVAEDGVEPGRPSRPHRAGRRRRRRRGRSRARRSPRRTRTTSARASRSSRIVPARLRRASRSFVGLFVIYNSFTILVAQRNREMALLRAIGAVARPGAARGAVRGARRRAAGVRARRRCSAS